MRGETSEKWRVVFHISDVARSLSSSSSFFLLFFHRNRCIRFYGLKEVSVGQDVRLFGSLSVVVLLEVMRKAETKSGKDGQRDSPWLHRCT